MDLKTENAASRRSRLLAQVLDFLEREIWPEVPQKMLGKRVSKKEREKILGYGRRGF